MKSVSMFKKVMSMLLVFTLLVTYMPDALGTSAYAAAGDTRIADPSTLDSWTAYFGAGANNFTTEYAGHVWTDKSVLTDDSAFSYAKELADKTNVLTLDGTEKQSFLVALSAMAASESIVGQSNKPTDTMIVLDLSSSMYRNESKKQNLPDTVNTMFSAVNNTIKKLQDLNVNNRVGVTIYYGGPDLNQAPKNSYQILLPLDRYTHSSNKYLAVTTNKSGILTKVGVNSNVRSQSTGKTVSGSRTVPDVSGTYTQQGILAALKEFLEADTTVPATASYQAGASRTPVMVIMSDGEPTAATSNYTKLDVKAEMGSNAVRIRSAAETDFLTQLTSAYAKAMMDAHYEKESPIVYTLSLVGQGKTVSYEVMDPSNLLGKPDTSFPNMSTVSEYWNKLLKNNSISITAKIAAGQWDSSLVNKKVTVSKTTVDGKSFPSSKNQMYYVDKAFEANTASQLTNAFEDIYTNISVQTHTYPTLVEDDENLDGYVSFVDRIGEYMHVSDVKGILIGTTWYSGAELSKNFAANGGNLGSQGDEMVWAVQKRLGIEDAATARTLLRLAYQNGQLSYKSKNDFSNYIGWYADESGKYLGFWHEGSTTQPKNAVFTVKSYGYLGETDTSHGVSESDLMYATVQVRTHLTTGEEIVTFAVPAALIPTVEYDVKLDSSGNPEALTRSGASKPIRLVYEVALDEAVNGITVQNADIVDAGYTAANTDKDGYVYFYTNQYDKDGNVGYNRVNTYSYFRPAHSNENYYYQENSTIYTDQNGTAYKSSNAPDTDGTYYRAVVIYKKDAGKITKETTYKQIASSVLNYAEKGSGSSWYIPKDCVFVNMAGYIHAKTSNATVTLPNANTAFIDVEGHFPNEKDHRFVVGDTLGNNGLVKVKPETGMKLTKKVEGAAASDETFEFTIQGSSGISGTYTATRISAAGVSSTETVRFTSGKAKVTLKDKETLYIVGLAAGNYTVQEEEEADFLLSGIKVDGTAVPGGTAEVAVEAQKVHEVNFTNVPRGTGALTVAKLVEGEFTGTDKTFDIKVTLDSIAVDTGDTFEVLYSGETQRQTVTVGADNSFILKLKDSQEAEIFGIPEGTTAAVTEPVPGPGFTAEYAVNGTPVSGGAATVIIAKEPTIDTVAVTNTYSPQSAKVKINLSGTKKLLDSKGSEIPVDQWDDGRSFQFHLQKYENGIWTDVPNGVTTVNKTKGNQIGFAIGELEFTRAGRYGYQVIEKNHGLTLEGISYDSTMHTFDVVVKDSGNGYLEAEVESSHGGGTSGFHKVGDTWVNNQINFTNINNQGHTSELIMIKKNLQNPSGSEKVSLEGYQFELYEYTNPADPSAPYVNATCELVSTTAPTDASGETYVSMAFDYDQVGTRTHYYRLKEKASGIPGMQENKEFFDFQVKVTSVHEGGVTSEIVNKDIIFDEFESGTAGEGETPIIYPKATFTNVYEPDEATVNLNVSKRLNGRPLQAGEFTFQLKQGDTVLQKKMNEDEGIDGRGIVEFDKLTFDKVGTYNYTVSEVKPAAADSVKDVTYDETVYHVVITVTDGGQGFLEASVNVLDVPGTEMVFENEYVSSKPVSIDVSGSKSLINWKNETMSMVNDQFTFLLQESDENGIVKAGGFSAQAKNKLDGTFQFEELKYNTTGKRYYVISESVPGTAYGIQYDPAKYLVTADVTYNTQTGGLEVVKTVEKLGTVSSGSITAIEFTNRYVPEAAEVTIPAQKVLEGKLIAENMFQFRLYEADSTWKKTNDAAKMTVFNDSEGKIAFALGSFSDEGTWRYIVEEVNEGKTGFTYDSKSYGITVIVADNQLGQLEAELSYVELSYASAGEGQTTVTANPTGAAVFSNSYEARPAYLSLTGSKTVTGTNAPVLTGGEFTFKLKGLDGAPMPDNDIVTVTNDAEGKFSYGQITYTMEGTYHYTIHEINGGMDIGGTAYDPAVYYVDVTVTDNAGQLTAAASYKKAAADGLESTAGSEAAFVNDYDPGKISISLKGEKTLIGKDLTEGGFAFELVPVTITTDPATQDEVRTEGTPVGMVTNRVDGTILFPALTYTLDDVEGEGTFTYVIREVKGSSAAGITYDEDEYDVVITITETGEILDAEIIIGGSAYTDPEQTPIKFENKYEPEGTSVIIQAAKELSGRKLQADDFTFELRDVSNRVIGTAKNTASGLVAFAAIDFADGEEGRYIYTVTEVNEGLGGITYDPAEHQVVIDVEDDGNGKLKAYAVTADPVTGAETKTLVSDGAAAAGVVSAGTFKNIYGDNTSKDAYLNLQVTKNLSGRDLKAGEFTFQISGSEGAPMPAETTAVNAADGTVKFGAVRFSTAGTYTYTITEVVPVNEDDKVPGVTYNSNDPENMSYTVEVTVQEDPAGGPLQVHIGGTLVTHAYNAGSFYNRYDAAGSVIIEAYKSLTGRTLQAGEFSFLLKDSTGKELETVTNDADGAIRFAPISYTSAGTYIYTVEEVPGTLSNVTYDTVPKTVTVQVEDNGDGTLTASDANGIAGYAFAGQFNNTYDDPYIPPSKDVYVPITAAKVMEGRNLAYGEFSFELKDQAGNVLQTKTNSSSGLVFFSALHFDEPGTYVYSVSEVAGSAEGVTYDSSVHNVTVVVTETVWGSLHAEVLIDGTEDGRIVFTNYFGEQPPEDPKDPEDPKEPEDPKDPETPDEPDEPGQPGNPDDEFVDLEEDTPYAGADPGNPKTSDESNVMMWLLVFAVSGMGAAGTWTLRRKMK